VGPTWGITTPHQARGTDITPQVNGTCTYRHERGHEKGAFFTGTGTGTGRSGTRKTLFLDSLPLQRRHTDIPVDIIVAHIQTLSPRRCDWRRPLSRPLSRAIGSSAIGGGPSLALSDLHVGLPSPSQVLLRGLALAAVEETAEEAVCDDACAHGAIFVDQRYRQQALEGRARRSTGGGPTSRLARRLYFPCPDLCPERRNAISIKFGIAVHIKYLSQKYVKCTSRGGGGVGHHPIGACPRCAPPRASRGRPRPQVR
jgi:hypothetical protein